MTTNYIGVPGNIAPGGPSFSGALPADGDANQAATFAGALQALLDQTAFLQRALVSTSLQSITQGTGTVNANDFAMSDGASPSVVAAGDTSGTGHWGYCLSFPAAFGGASSAVSTRARGVVWVSPLGLYVGVTSVAASGAVAIETAPASAGIGAWTPRAVPTTTSTGDPTKACCIAYGVGLAVPIIVAALANTGQVISSTDAITWTARGTGTMSGQVITTVSFGGGVFIAVSATGYVFTSPDGTTWTARGSVFTGSAWTLAYSAKGAVWVASQSLGGSGYWYSTNNGATWTSRTFSAAFYPTAASLNFIGAAFGFILAQVNSSCAMYLTQDGINWSFIGGTAGVPMVTAKWMPGMPRVYFGASGAPYSSMGIFGF